MNTRNLAIVSAIIIIAAAAGYIVLTNQAGESDPNNDTAQADNTSETNQQQDAENNDIADSTTEEMNTVSGVGRYIINEPYDESKLANSPTDKNILFFSLESCPTCRVLRNDINDSLDDIPGDVTIFRVDYGSEFGLNQKYGVTYQHTLVQVDKQGNQLKKWNQSYSLEQLLAEVI